MTENTKRVFGALLTAMQIYIATAEAAPTKPARDAFAADRWRATTAIPTPDDPLKVKIPDYYQVYFALKDLEFLLKSLVQLKVFPNEILTVLKSKEALLESAKVCELAQFSKEMLGLIFAIESRVHREGNFIYDFILNKTTIIFDNFLSKHGSCQGI